MKILIHAKSMAIKGGAERAAFLLASEMVTRGHSVDISVCRNAAPAYPLPDGVGYIRLMDGVRRSKKVVGSACQQPLNALVEKERYDVVLGWLRHGGGMVGWIPKRLGAVRILAMRNYPYNIVRTPRLPWKWVKHWHRQKGFARADAWFVQQPQFVSLLPKAWQAGAHVLPNAVAIPSTDAQRPREKLVIAVARLIGVKRLDALIEGFARFHATHSDWRLEIWGEGKPEKLDISGRLQSLIDDARLGDAARLMGVTDRIDAVYARAAIMAHPSRMEGMSNSVAEALARGLPVIAAADCLGMEEMIRDGETGVLIDGAGSAQPLDQQIDDALSVLADDPERAGRMGQAARAFMVDTFSSAAIYDRWETELQRIVAGEREKAG